MGSCSTIPASFQYERYILVTNKEKFELKKPHFKEIMGQVFSQEANSPPASPTLAKKQLAEVEERIKNGKIVPGGAVSEAELNAKAEAEAKAKAEAEEAAKLEAEAAAKAEAEAKAKAEA